MKGVPGLVEPCAGASHNLFPFGGIGFDGPGKFLRRPAGWFVTDLGKLLLECFRDERLVDGGIELVHDRSRHTGRSDHSRPSWRQVTWHTGFCNSWKLRKRRRAHSSADTQCTYFAVTRKGRDRLQAFEHDVDMARNQIGDRRGTAAIGHVDDLGLSHVLEQFPADVTRRSVAG